MYPVPDTRAFADSRAVVDDGGGMYGDVSHGSQFGVFV
jgi:hypothetical protein